MDPTASNIAALTKHIVTRPSDEDDPPAVALHLIAVENLLCHSVCLGHQIGKFAAPYHCRSQG